MEQLEDIQLERQREDSLLLEELRSLQLMDRLELKVHMESSLELEDTKELQLEGRLHLDKLELEQEVHKLEQQDSLQEEHMMGHKQGLKILEKNTWLLNIHNRWGCCSSRLRF